MWFVRREYAKSGELSMVPERVITHRRDGGVIFAHITQKAYIRLCSAKVGDGGEATSPLE